MASQPKAFVGSDDYEEKETDSNDNSNIFSDHETESLFSDSMQNNDDEPKNDVYSPEKKDTTEQFVAAVKAACTRYLGYFNKPGFLKGDDIRSTHPNGFFSHWRHGDIGKNRAYALYEKFGGEFNKDDTAEAIQAVMTLLKKENAWYHQKSGWHHHSLNSYIVDALIEHKAIDYQHKDYYSPKERAEIIRQLENLFENQENSIAPITP